MLIKGKKRRRIYIIMRYSILSNEKGAWHIGREQKFEDYKASLFDQSRLDFHHQIFTKYVLPSLEKQSAGLDNVELLIYTSKNLPQHARKKLDAAVASKSWVKVIGLEPEVIFQQEVRDYIKNDNKGRQAIIATVRLDDDDLLAISYLDMLWKYVKKGFVEYSLTFPNGFICRLNQQDMGLVQSLSIKAPKTGLGLAYISHYNGILGKFKSKFAHIYEVGNHTNVDKKGPMIADYSTPAYLRTSYEEQDTRDANFDKMKEKSAVATRSEVRKWFELADVDFLREHP